MFNPLTTKDILHGNLTFLCWSWKITNHWRSQNFPSEHQCFLWKTNFKRNARTKVEFFNHEEILIIMRKGSCGYGMNSTWKFHLFKEPQKIFTVFCTLPVGRVLHKEARVAEHLGTYWVHYKNQNSNFHDILICFSLQLITYHFFVYLYSDPFWGVVYVCFMWIRQLRLNGGANWWDLRSCT